MKGWTQSDIDRINAKNSQNKAKSTPNVSTQGERGKTGRKGQTVSGNERLQALGRMKSGKMNKTETDYAQRLEVLKQTGKIQWYAFDQINLRIAEKCFYKVDFFVMTDKRELEAHEVKGGFITDDSLVKIKVAASIFPFRFIIAQLKKGEWKVREF